MRRREEENAVKGVYGEVVAQRGGTSDYMDGGYGYGTDYGGDDSLAGLGGTSDVGSGIDETGADNSGTDEQTDTRSAWEKYRDEYINRYNGMYERNGKRAMQDTLGEISARTGGLASSYAGAVAQETYDNYMAQLADRYPELAKAAYSMYQIDQAEAAKEAAALAETQNRPRSSASRLIKVYPEAEAETQAAPVGSGGSKTPPKVPSGVTSEEAAKQREQDIFQLYTEILNSEVYSPTAAWAAARAEADGNSELMKDILLRYRRREQ